MNATPPHASPASLPRLLEGKVALVTGAASGIGRATALAFAHAGAHVVLADIAAEAGRQAVGAIEAAGGQAIFVETDVSSSADVQRLISTTVAAFGRLDCAHNNAGLSGGDAKTHDYPEELWARVLAVNLTGVFLCLKYELAHMRQQTGGAIVNTASVAGLVGGSGPAYVASKHGVVGLTKGAALENARHNIRVNAVCPGVILTPMVEAAFAARRGLERLWRAGHPIGRFGTAEEVAATVVWLCSDAASFITGAALPVDGGVLAQ